MRFAQWRLGDDALIQCVTFDASGEELGTDEMSGKEAHEELRHAEEHFGEEHGPQEWVADERGVYGYVEAGGDRVEYWDCDEQSYSEWLEEG